MLTCGSVFPNCADGTYAAVPSIIFFLSFFRDFRDAGHLEGKNGLDKKEKQDEERVGEKVCLR